MTDRFVVLLNGEGEMLYGGKSPAMHNTIAGILQPGMWLGFGADLKRAMDDARCRLHAYKDAVATAGASAGAAKMGK
jgi:hypothetical protein